MKIATYSQQSIQWHLNDNGPKFLVQYFDITGNVVHENIGHHGNIHYARNWARYVMTIPPNKHYHSFTVKRIGNKELMKYFKDKTELN